MNAAAERGDRAARTTSLGYRSQPTPHAAFAAMITRMDRDIGRLCPTLRERGPRRHTLVMFTSDNGPHQEGGADPAFFNSSGGLRGIKRDLYEGGIRVPMIVRWPGTIPAGRVSDARVGALGHVADARRAGRREGAGRHRRRVDAARAARDGRSSARVPVLGVSRTRFPAGGADGTVEGVRPKNGAPLELYDLEADPGETRDVAAQNPGVIARVEGYLRRARTESDQWKTP